MRVLQLISSTGFYGAESVVTLLSAHLTRLGCEVRLGVLHARGSEQRDLFAAAEERGIAVVDLVCNGRFDLRTLSTLVRLLRRERIDVLHTHGYKANAYGVLAARLAGSKLIATCHNWTDRTEALRRYRQLDMYLLRSFDAVVAVSDTVAATLIQGGFAPSRAKVIHNGIETAAYRGAPSDQPSPGPAIGSVARLSPEKGVDVLIRALPRILETEPQLRCIVAGEGPERQRLERLAEELGVAHCLVLAGFEKDIAGFLAGCTVVAQTSRVEGLPVAVLEAMAAQKAIVATAVGDVPALLRGGAAGLLVQPDQPEALADGVLRLLRDEALRERLAGQALLHVQQHFEASIMAGHYRTVYHAITRRAMLPFSASAPSATVERAR